MDEVDRELLGQLVLAQFQNALLFLGDREGARGVLRALLKVPGGDPLRDARIMVWRWGVRCFLNRIEAGKPPDVPLDFSKVHPELSDRAVIMGYARTSAEDLLRLVETFPYEVYKIVGAMKGAGAVEFLNACGRNEGLPCQLVGRFVSMFPIAELQFDYPEVMFEKRCKELGKFGELFEGLLCNCESKQIVSAQYLASHFDSVLKDDVLQFANQCIRVYQHFIDKNLALTIHLFPECITLTFLLQAEMSPMSALSPLLKRLPPSHFVTRFRNQIALMQICGVSDDWNKLNQVSVPKLLDFEMVYSGFLDDFPRDSIFVTLPNSHWETDYDFLDKLLIFRTIISGKEVPDFDSDIAVDIFALLFAKEYKRARLRKRSSSMNFLSDKPGSPYDLLSDAFIDCSGKFILSFDYADKLIEKLESMDTISGVLKNYVHRAKIKFEALKLLFDNPTIHMAFVPPTFIYTRALKSIEIMEKLICVYGQPPAFAQSKIFSQKLAERIGIASQDNAVSLFGHRKKKNMKEYIPLAQEMLKMYPSERHTLFLLDFASSFSGFVGMLKDIDLYPAFVEHVQKRVMLYPKHLDISPQGCTILDYNTKITAAIAKFHKKTGFGYQFCLYLKQILTNDSVSLSKLLSQKPEHIILSVLKKVGSFAQANDSFSSAGVNLLPVLYGEVNSEKQLNRDVVMEIVKHNPVAGIPYAWTVIDLQSLASLDNISSPLRGFIKRVDLVRKRKRQHKNPPTGEHPTVNVLRQRTSQSMVPDILASLKTADAEEVMNVLEDLMYRFDLEQHIETVLGLVKDCPHEWQQAFLESLLVLMSADSNALVTCSTRLSELKGVQKENDRKADEELIADNWNYLMEIISDISSVLDNPAHIYALTVFHLKWHQIGRHLVWLCQHFCRIIIYEREAGIFQSRDDEAKWIQQFLGNDFSQLTEHTLVQIVMDLMLTFSAGRENIHQISHSREFIPVLLERLPESIALLSYVDDPEPAINAILTSQTIDSVEKEASLLRMLWHMHSVANHCGLWRVLKLFGDAGFYTRYHQSYSCRDMSTLRDQAELFDLHDVLRIFDELGIPATSSISERLDRNKITFGLSRSNVGEKEAVCCMEDIPFAVEPGPELDSCWSTMYTADVDSGSITLYKTSQKIRKRFGSNIKPCDFMCFDVSSVCIASNPQDTVFQTFMAFNGPNTAYTPEVTVESGDVVQLLTDSIASSSVVEFFCSCSPQVLHEVVVYANEHSLLFLLLQITMWILTKPDYYSAFEFGSTTEENMLEYLTCLRETLALASSLVNQIDPSLLLPPHVIAEGQKEMLEDCRMVIRHQIDIGVDKLSLFDPKANKAKTLSKLFIANDFDRGFALTRILHVDIDEVMIEACAQIGQSSNEELAGFLFGVLPHLEPESANRLIEALASVLGRSSEKETFIQLLVSGFGDKKNVYHMLRWFGSLEHASLIALDGGLRSEIEESNKEAQRRKNAKLLRQTNRWLLQHRL